jgi:hypothetical protein
MTESRVSAARSIKTKEERIAFFDQFILKIDDVKLIDEPLDRALVLMKYTKDLQPQAKSELIRTVFYKESTIAKELECIK